MRKGAGPRGLLGGGRGTLGPARACAALSPARAIALGSARVIALGLARAIALGPARAIALGPARAIALGQARAFAALATAVFALALASPARGEGPFDGAWSAGALNERWVTGDWGEACGPKPASQGMPAATVMVTQQSGELIFSGGGYNRTSSCYEAGLALRVRSHTAAARSWRTECGSDANDSRQAHLVSTLSAPSDTILVFDETGEYQFLIKGQNCTASVRRSRTYVRARPSAPAVPPPSAPPAETAVPQASTALPAPPAPPSGRCESPGEPAKLEVRPQRKLLRPGQSFAFRTLVLDAAGCRLPQAPAWAIVQGAEGVAVNAAGNVSVPAEAPEGEIVLQASVGARSVRVTVEVAGEGRYAELLADRGGWPEGDERGEVAEVVLNTPRIGVVTVTAPDQRGERRALFLAVVAASATVLAIIGLVLRSRRGGVVRREDDDDMPSVVRAEGGPWAPPSTPGPGASAAGFAPSPAASNHGASPGASGYGASPGASGYGASPGASGYGASPGASGSGASGYGASPGASGSGASGYGANPGASGSGASGYGANPGASAYGASPGASGYGASPGASAYGAGAAGQGPALSAPSAGASAPSPSPAGESGVAHEWVCPVCGRRYAGDARFCGQEGAALVALNERG